MTHMSKKCFLASNPVTPLWPLCTLYTLSSCLWSCTKQTLLYCKLLLYLSLLKFVLATLLF